MMSSSVLASIAGVAGVAAAAVWLAYLVRFHRAGRDFPELSPAAPAPHGSGAPRISVIVSGKDEQDSIEACVRSVLGQDYPNLELVAVDDRSSDDTRAILGRLRDEYGERLRVLHVDELPADWGGQCHGLHRGVAASTGHWLCFTDADCQLDSPSTIATAWHDARANGAELLSILPRLDAPTAWEKLYLPLCSFMLLMRLRIDDVNDPDSGAAYANGAFMLIRRSTYADLGGHERVRGYVNDDVRLAELAKRAGARVRVVGNQGLVRTRMYPSIRSAWAGWSRNFYGTLRTSRRLREALGFTLALFVAPWLAFATALALAAGGHSAFELVAACWAMPVAISHVGLSRLYRACAIGSAWSLAYLPGAVFVAAMLSNATLRAHRRAGTIWQGVHYEHPS